MSANHEKVEALFLQALQYNPSERAAFLAGACGEDVALRSKLEELLQAQDQAGPFLPEAPKATAVPVNAVTEQPGDTIGRYKLREKIGEGGCGVVYVAEQETPVRRRVALKVIKPGMDTQQVIARFEAERQALAMMDHPNIAKVLDGGTTDTGRPYFVMELVRGIRITDYCDQSNLTTRDRLDLFIQVCQAVQHAHQKGIIHRDLKPSNILVTLHDGVPVPKVIDFGIAKATEGRLTEATVYTELHQFMGTPAYMSPEQAEMSGLDIDTRSDIYSLGVLLYQLLTSKTPFDGKELLALGIDEMRRTIREKEPMRPSTRLANLQRDELTTTAKRRSADAPRLIHLLKGDLDWIVMKCLEKDRQRRYETANGLAMDIERHLGNEPVLARPPSAAYRFQKLVRRNKGAFAAAGAVAATLVLGVVISAWQAIRATRAERQESSLRQQAQANELKARQAKAGEEEQRHVAEGNAAQAQASAAQAQATVTRLEIDRAEMLFGNEQSAEALAYLARVLRREPTNRVAGERIISALAQRNFCVPLFRAEHKANVTSAEFSPDGRRVLTASKDGTARIWDGRTGQPLLGPFQHASEVTSAHFSPDGARVVTTSLDQTARLWDARTGLPASVPLLHEAAVTCADFSPNGQLVTGSADGLTHFWIATTGARVGEPIKNDGSLNYVKFSPNGNWLTLGLVIDAPGANTGRFLHGLGKILSAASGKEVAMTYLLFGESLDSSTQFRPDDSLAVNIASGTQLNLVPMLDPFLLRRSEVSHDSDVISVRFSPDGQSLVTGSKDSTARISDADTLQPVGEKIVHENWVNSVDFSPDGRQLVTGAKDHTGRVWDTRTGRPLCEPFRHDAVVLSVQFSPDGQRILSRCDGPGVWVWEVRCGGPLTASLQHETPVRKAVFSPDGGRVATTDWRGRGHYGVARLWDARQAILALPPLGPGIWDVGFSRDGSRLFAVDGNSGGCTLSVWDSRTGRHAGPLFQNTNMAAEGWNAQLSPDGQCVLLAGSGGKAKVWRVATGQLVSELTHQEGVNFSRFSPDGQWVVTTSKDKTARLWHWETGRPMTDPLRHDGEVVWVDVSPDSRLVATLSRDRTARIWEAASGRWLQTLVHAQEPYHWHSIQFSSDGRRVATAAGNVGQVWDVQTGQPVAAPLKHNGRVNSVRFSPDGQRLVTACHDGSARIWDVTSGHLVSEPLQHRERVNYAEFSPDGHWVVTASQDGTARIWEVPTLTPSMPLWLADWAEAVAGYRIDLQDTSQSVGFERTRRVRQALAQSAPSAVADEASRWANWFYADNASRTISPGSLLMTPQLAQQRIDVGTLESLQQAVRLSPTNGLAQARLAWLTLTNETAPSSNQIARADWQSRHALALAPEDPEVLLARAQVCERLGRLSEAWELMERGSRFKSARPDFWNVKGRMLEQTNRLEEAYQAYSQALSLAGSNQAFQNVRRDVWVRRSNLLRRLNRPTESKADYEKFVDTLTVAMEANNLAAALTVGPPGSYDPERALLLAQRAVRLDPKAGLFVVTLGEAYYRAEQYGKAVETLREAERLTADGRWSDYRLLFLAMSHHQLRESELARASFEQALQWLREHPDRLSKTVKALQAEAEALLSQEKQL